MNFSFLKVTNHLIPLDYLNGDIQVIQRNNINSSFRIFNPKILSKSSENYQFSVDGISADFRAGLNVSSKIVWSWKEILSYFDTENCCYVCYFASVSVIKSPQSGYSQYIRTIVLLTRTVHFELILIIIQNLINWKFLRFATLLPKQQGILRKPKSK